MSPFEKLPQEIRDLIYEHCLLYDGEINPHPTWFERIEMEERDCVPAKMMNCGNIGIFRKPNMRYSKQWPSVALLGVKRAIQREAATILFGKNVWRISDTQQCAGINIFDSYSSYFRHIVTSFDMRDVHPQQLMKITNYIMATLGIYGEETDSRIGTRRTEAIHNLRNRALCITWAFKRMSLERMQLKTLVLDIRNLFCLNGCCRLSVIKLLCEQLGRRGPWYRLEQAISSDSLAHFTPIEAKRSTDVKVVGLGYPQEARLIQEIWGLDIIHMEVDRDGPGHKRP